MRRNNKVDPRKAKVIARQKFAERKIDKWINWSWNNKGKIVYKELVKKQNKYNIECHGWTRNKEMVN